VDQRDVEIKLRDRKKEPVEIRVVEHLYRWSSWDITAHSDDFRRPNAQTIEFRLPVKPTWSGRLTYNRDLFMVGFRTGRDCRRARRGSAPHHRDRRSTSPRQFVWRNFAV